MIAPFFSICIPAYNCGEIILEALKSISSQSFADWEVVVFDDGSRDETPSICRNQSIIPPSRYSFAAGRHGGQLLARKQLAERARGKVVVSLDADDTFVGTDALERIHEAFSRTGCDVVAFNATRSLSAMTKFVDYSGVAVDAEGRADMASVRSLFCSSYALNNVAFKAYRRDLMPFEEELPELNMTEDRYQTTLLLQKCSSMTVIDAPLYYYRVNASSVTEAPFKLKYFEDQMYVEEKVTSIAAGWSVDGNARNELILSAIMGDLVSIASTITSSGERISMFKAIRNDAHCDHLLSAKPSLPRVDQTIAIRAFAARRFAFLDKWLGIRRSIKGLANLRS